MTRIQPIKPETATTRTAELYNAIKSQLGVVPNLHQTMATSLPLLEGYISLSGALGKGTLGLRTATLIALTVAEANACDYCLSAHTYIGANMAKLDAGVMQDARQGQAADTKTAAILQLAKTLVAKRGQLNNADVDAARNAGVTDAEIGEVVGHVALNTLTNYFNNTAGTAIDFPVVAHGNVAVV